MEIDAQKSMQNKIILAFFSLLFITTSYKGQRHELGVQLGMSSLVGDIGRTNYIFQGPVSGGSEDYGFPFYGGVLYRMNFNPYQTVRLNLGFSNIQFVDKVAKEQYRRDRNLWGTNSIIEADVLFEYNFFPVNNEQKSLLSPYIFAGIGGLYANESQLSIENDFTRDGNGNALAPTNDQDFQTTSSYTSKKKITMAIPFGIGLKYKFNYNWALFGEFMFRPTFSDSIDYSVVDEKGIKVNYNKDILSAGSTVSLLEESPYVQIAEQRAAELVQNRQIGNINSNDWINSVTFGITYSFGRPPCYCEN
jgi:hypothetical protein